MRRIGACILPLALAIILAGPAGECRADSSLAAWGAWNFSHESHLDTWKAGGEYEWRTTVPLVSVLEWAVALPFEYYSVEPNGGRFDDVEITTYSFIPTAKLYLVLLSSLHPYVGAGVGWARTDFDDPINDSEDSLAWRVVAGAEYLLWPASPFLLFGEYEYTTIEIEDQPGEPDVGGDAVVGGVRLRF